MTSCSFGCFIVPSSYQFKYVKFVIVKYLLPLVPEGYDIILRRTPCRACMTQTTESRTKNPSLNKFSKQRLALWRSNSLHFTFCWLLFVSFQVNSVVLCICLRITPTEQWIMKVIGRHRESARGVSRCQTSINWGLYLCLGQGCTAQISYRA